ncbi:MAG: M1 family aminopeptidase [Planctomycetota bacterium]|jgi:aminopeptidase N
MLDKQRPDRMLLAVAVSLALSSAAGAGGGEACLAGKLERAEWSSKAWDEATGRDLRNYPPDRVVDYLHMTLRMRFDDLDEKRFTATETLRFAPIGRPAEAVTLDAVNLRIGSVTLDGGPLEYFYDDERLTLRFEPPLVPDRPREVVIDYECVEPGAGMVFTPSSTEVTDYAAQVHTTGQTATNRYWFACHDSPNERLATELIVDVPSGFAVSGNGRLVSRRDDGQRAVWHWLQDKPHVNYLVVLVIGKFDMVEIPHPRVPMEVWVPPGLGHQVMQTYGRTGEMIDVLEHRFGHPYPWDRYDQVVVKNFGPGGMENTSITTMYPTAILDETALADESLEGLISHELAHQWAGDMFTCKSWAHVWLNEGWATYGAALWFEHRDGEDGYLDSMRRNFGRLAHRDKTTNDQPMVSNVYEGAWENFGRAANPYPKGASILHMLRMMLGDEVFFDGLGLFMNRHALGVVETHDARYAMEEVSGLGLEWFFDQWCYRPGIPRLDVGVDYDGATRELQVEVMQTQHVDDRTPAFRFVLPIYVETSTGYEVFDLDVRAKTASWRTTLDGPPSIVAVDPWLHVLKTAEVDKPNPLWMEQAKHGPTIASRHAAIEALADRDTPQVVELLTRIIGDESSRHTLRQTAVRTLAGLGSKQARTTVLDITRTGVADARVREPLIRTLEEFEADQVVTLLAEVAQTDPSYATRVAAIEALAHHGAAQHADLIAELVDAPSQHDQIRRAALLALADLDDPRGLDLGIQYSAYGYMDRARPAAIKAVGKLAHHDPDRAVEYLIALLDDPERRTVAAAGDALAETGDDRALEPLRAISEAHPNPRLRRQAERWLKKLEG